MSNEEQIEYWNGESGKRWAAEDDTMARLLQPICEALLDHANVENSRNALDIGCGGGSQSLLLAQRLRSDSSVTGVDISAPMLEVAREKAMHTDASTARLDFLQADAANYAFEPASFDLLFSRFGVMFFDDPVAAFSNLRKALDDKGRLAFCCWQPLQDNDWTFLPIKAALQYVEPPEAQDPHAPGPFAFADPTRVKSILQEAGFTDIEIISHITDVRFGEGKDLSKSVRELAQIGPVSRLLTGVDEDVLENAISAMEQALAPYHNGEALVLPGAIWFVTADAAPIDP